MRILVCGGAGYIGSHLVKYVLEKGHQVVVIDNLSTGHGQAVAGIEFHQADVGDEGWLSSFLSSHHFDLVMHFCAYSLVGESVEQPEKYFQNNVGNTLTLLKVMRATGHDRLVFSSTAAIYGEPEANIISESHPKQPINPYGRSKWMVEQILQDYAKAYGLRSVSLRYFNAAGADPSAAIGEKHNPETHLIPNILKSVASGGSLILKLFGNNYPTPDGSCVRDYIHVNDLASAHLLAGEYLLDADTAEMPVKAYAFNLGVGKGFSVLEVIEAASKVTGQNITYEICDRRPGDPAVLVADPAQAREVLGWKPEYTEIESIIETAWQWHKGGEKFKNYGYGYRGH